MRIRLLSAVILIGTVISACGDLSSSMKSVDERPEGQRLFERHCKGCHGKSGGLSFGGAAVLSSSVMNHLEIETVISKGRGNMLGFERLLTEGEITLMAEYVEGLQKFN